MKEPNPLHEVMVIHVVFRLVQSSFESLVVSHMDLRLTSLVIDTLMRRTVDNSLWG